MYAIDSKRYVKELNGALGLAHLAGSVMLRYYDLNYAVSTKSEEASPEAAIFTEVDGKVDQIAGDYFASVWAEDELLTEEREPSENWHLSRRIWIVDPIDGTMGYKKKTDAFGISIALVEDGRPVVGVLYAPAQNLIAWATSGEGAYLNGAQVDLRDNKGSLETLICSSNAVNRSARQRALELINPQGVFEVVTTESVVAKALLLLRGEGQLYPILPLSSDTRSAPKFWDIAAADLILHEAGGVATTFFGEKYRYNIPDFQCVHGALMGTRSAHATGLSRLSRGN